MLSRDLEITPEQSQKIQERRYVRPPIIVICACCFILIIYSRDVVLRLLAQLKESLGLLQSLKIAIEHKHASYDGVIGRVQKAGSPKQTVLFLLWLAKSYPVFSKFIPQQPTIVSSGPVPSSSQQRCMDSSISSTASGGNSQFEATTSIFASNGRAGASSTAATMLMKETEMESAASVTSSSSYLAAAAQGLLPRSSSHLDAVQHNTS